MHANTNQIAGYGPLRNPSNLHSDATSGTRVERPATTSDPHLETLHTSRDPSALTYRIYKLHSSITIRVPGTLEVTSTETNLDLRAMIYITEAQAKAVINVKSALPVFRRAYLQCNDGDISTGPRLVMPVDNKGDKGQWLTANYPAEGFFGTKFSAVFPGNLQQNLPATISTISLYSGQTGELKAVVEANALTAIKTAGSAAIATDLLSRKDSSTLAIIGSGLQAFDQVLAIRQVRNIRHVIVYDLDVTRAEKFVGFLQAVDGYDVHTTVAGSADEAVAAADVVCTCTTSKRPVFKGSSLRAGTHVNAIGSYAPDMQEIDSETVMRSSCVVTEHVEGLWAAAGDILDPFEKGLIDKDKVDGSVGDVLAGSVLGRQNDDQITLYESVGSAVLDLAIAVETYKQVTKTPSVRSSL